MIESFVRDHEGYPLDFNTGEVMSRIVKIPLIFTEYFQNMKNYILPYMISFTFTAGLILHYNKLMGVIIICCALIIFIMIFLSPKICGKVAGSQEQTHATLDDQIDDILNNLQVIYATNNVEKEMKRLNLFEQRYNYAYGDTMHCVLNGRIFSTVLLSTMIISFVLVAQKGLKNKTLTTGAFITILTVISQWFGTLGWLAGMMKDIITEWGVISSFVPPQRESSLIKKDKGPTETLKHPKDLIWIANLTYSPKPETNIIRNLNLDVRQGERIVLVGDIGSGKSTLLKVLAGLYIPTSGFIMVDGVPLNLIPKSKLKTLIGYVPQNPLLFNRTILENIKYGVEDANDKLIVSLINSLGLQDAFEDLQKLVGKGGMNLSGGQRQLIAVLRCILLNPRILLMDEITSSIDSKTKKKLFDVLLHLFRGKTVIMTTHDKDLLSLSTRVIQMKDGAIVKA
jgi:ABC-type bacteriocin/lantibiotic exporter with double-glycine peptidase domain